MKKEKLIYDFVVGYMLKVIKSKAPIHDFCKQFNAIKHGDYVEFIDLLNVGIPDDIVVYKIGQGIIETKDQLSLRNVDFAFLLLASTSLKKFYHDCHSAFGDIIDEHLTDNDFEKLANFEMLIRMFYNKEHSYDGRKKLYDIINEYFKDKEISNEDLEILQNARKFLNMVKGHKAHFRNYKEGLIEFDKSLKVLEKYNIILEV